MSHHPGAKKREEHALDFLGAYYSDRVELGEYAEPEGHIGVGTPPGHYPVTITLESKYGTPNYYEEREHSAAIMRQLGWSEIGSPDPTPDNAQKIIFNVRPEVVKKLLSRDDIKLQGAEHFNPETAASMSR